MDHGGVRIDHGWTVKNGAVRSDKQRPIMPERAERSVQPFRVVLPLVTFWLNGPEPVRHPYLQPG